MLWNRDVDARTKVDEGEIRYEFSCFHRPGRGPYLLATFQGPRLGTEFEMDIADARKMRADLDAAIKRFETVFPNHAFSEDSAS